MSDPATLIAVTPWGGPTVLIEYGPLRLLTDPTFDPAGSYPIRDRALVKTEDAIIHPEELGRIDAVLLSHDQHPDNLDRAGRRFLSAVPLVVTTEAAAARLDAVTTRHLAPWAATDLDGVTVTAVPAQHGPDGSEARVGPVIGFVLTAPGLPTVYVSGDNASLDVVAAIAERFPDIDVAILHAGAARTPIADGPLTLTSADAVVAARLLGRPRILGVHTDGWAHFTEHGEAFAAAFQDAGLGDLLLEPGPGTTSVP